MNKIKTFDDLTIAYCEQPSSYITFYNSKEELDKLKAETDLLMKKYKRWKWTHRGRKCR